MRKENTTTQTTSKAAVLGLVLAIIPVTAVLGLIFSLTAFEHIEKYDLKGSHFAKLGTIISVIWMLLFIVAGFFLFRYFG
ncbi:hypothetical protein [Pseudolactococcus insecticola]|uniref:DUF4190 domain-containing protein n=1 Tax=Pseudolactococcus insecticola TaxID=2709158 RepID=A0A6A0B8M9_9LACT|nr:hypothetical protein [Lactococcus insecticola]GFH40187.1 hypothetical protein Hs20B_05850 [Lactococcus insecticola]